jgi:DNA invertase Pin-like site-specific DNA recombinase
MRVAAYIRVSSKPHMLDMQRVAVARAARAQRDTITQWYSDKQSAGTLSRPGLGRLRQDAREGRVPRLYVYRLDRLARSGIRDTFEVIVELRRHRCGLVTVADGFNLAGPAADVVLAVMAWAARMERLAINERITSARLRLEQEGRSCKRPPRLSPLEKARVASLRRGGATIREIAVAVRAPRATVARALSQKVGFRDISRPYPPALRDATRPLTIPCACAGACGPLSSARLVVCSCARPPSTTCVPAASTRRTPKPMINLKKVLTLINGG